MNNRDEGPRPMRSIRRPEHCWWAGRNAGAGHRRTDRVAVDPARVRRSRFNRSDDLSANRAVRLAVSRNTDSFRRRPGTDPNGFSHGDRVLALYRLFTIESASHRFVGDELSYNMYRVLRCEDGGSDTTSEHATGPMNQDTNLVADTICRTVDSA